MLFAPDKLIPCSCTVLITVEEKSQKIEIGSKVKWEDKGKPLTGIVEKETASNYKICCKPGKKPGDKGSVYQVPKDKVELDQ